MRKSAPYALIRHLDATEERLPTREGVLAWAEREGLRELWDAQPEFGCVTPPELDTAWRIFANHGTRARMGLLLFSRAGMAEIAEVAAAHLEVEIEESGVELYRRIFWDASEMTRSDWTLLMEQLKTKEEKHHLALGFEHPTLDSVRRTLGGEVTVEPDVVLRRLMTSALEQYDLAMKLPLPSANDVFKWGEMAKSSAVALAAHQPKKVESNSIPKDFNGLFSVQVSKSKHISLADLQGQVGIPEPAKPVEDP